MYAVGRAYKNVMVETRQYQNSSERGSCFILGSQRSHCHNNKKSGVVDTAAARASGGKDECQVPMTGTEREYWMGTEISRLGGYGFRGTVAAGDGSNQKGGEMGAGYLIVRGEKKRQQRIVGREEEGSSSNRPELAALALRGTPLTNPTLCLCDNQRLAVASADESCEKMGRQRRKNDVSTSARYRHFTGTNRRALKKNNSRSNNVSGQSESASRRNCK